MYVLGILAGKKVTASRLSSRVQLGNRRRNINRSYGRERWEGEDVSDDCGEAERAGNRGGGAGASRERPGARFKFALGMPCGSDYSAFTYEELPRAADGD